MLRAVAISWLIGDALLHILSFALAWTSVQVVFTPQPEPGLATDDLLGSPHRIIAFLWLLLVSAVMLLAIGGLLASGLGLLNRKVWWRQYAIVSALTSIVALLPWLALLPPLSLYLLITMDVVIVISLALPWGDFLVREVQRR